MGVTFVVSGGPVRRMTCRWSRACCCAERNRATCVMVTCEFVQLVNLVGDMAFGDVWDLRGLGGLREVM